MIVWDRQEPFDQATIRRLDQNRAITDICCFATFVRRSTSHLDERASSKTFPGTMTTYQNRLKLFMVAP